MPSPLRQVAGRYNGLRATRSPDDPEVIAAERDLEAARLEAKAAEIISTWPELAPSQRAKLAALLRPVAVVDTGGRAT